MPVTLVWSRPVFTMIGQKTTLEFEHPACRMARIERPREDSQKLDWETPLATLHTEGH